jgi:hypothetical protein
MLLWKVAGGVTPLLENILKPGKKIVDDLAHWQVKSSL